MSDANDETSPLPVPGFEHLVWREPALRIPVTGRHHLPELVARGEDVALVFAGGPTDIAELSSLRIEQPFATWPPRFGEAAVHAPRELANSPFKVAPWLDDELLFLLDEPFAVRCGVPGARSLGIDVVNRDQHGRPMGASMGSARPHVGANPEHGIYLVRSRREVQDGPLSYSLEHRRVDRLDAPRLLGDLAGPTSLGAVLDDGSFLFARMHAPPGVRIPTMRRPKDPPIYYEVELFRAADGTIASCGRLPSPPESNATALVAAKGGGAWIAFSGPHATSVVRLDGAGRPVGEPWIAPFVGGSSPKRTRLIRWRDGVAMVTERGAMKILASDGTKTTRVATNPVAERNMFDGIAALASPDGRSVLVAHSLLQHIQVLRADFVPAGSSDAESLPVDVWTQDREAIVRAAGAAERRAARPPRVPGMPIETTADGSPPPRSHAKERIVEQIRMRNVLRAISGLHFGSFARLRGDETEGTFFDDNGCGDFVAFAWSADGLIAIGFDHENNPDAGAEESELRPEQHFPDLPPALQPMLDRLLPVVRRHATGGLWVTTGDAARWCEHGDFPEDFVRYTMHPEPAVFDALGRQSWLELTSVSEAQARLAIRLAAEAAMGPREISTEEEAVLLRKPEGDGEVDEQRLLAAAKVLAWSSVKWPAGEKRANEAMEARRAAALDALGEPQVALLRAANDGDVEAVRNLLAKGADPRCVAFDGMFDRTVEQVRYLARITPMALATLRGHAEVVEALLATLSEGEAVDGAEQAPETDHVEGGATRIAALKGDATMLAMLGARLPVEDGLYGLALGNVAGAQGLRDAPSLEVARLLLDRGLVPHKRWAAEIVAAAEAAGDDALAARARQHAPAATEGARTRPTGRRPR